MKLVIEYILGGILLVFSIAMIIVIILQEGNTQGLGTITGGADTFLSKNKARSLDAFLARWTKIFVIGFVLVVIGINCVEHFMDTPSDVSTDDTSSSYSENSDVVDTVDTGDITEQAVRYPNNCGLFEFAFLFMNW